MDINNMKHVQTRIQEIKTRFKNIQEVYSKPIQPHSVPNNASTQEVKPDAVKSSDTAQTVTPNTQSIKIAEELLKKFLINKQEKSSDAIDVQQIQSLLQNAVKQYTSSGTVFNIDE